MVAVAGSGRLWVAVAGVDVGSGGLRTHVGGGGGGGGGRWWRWWGRVKCMAEWARWLLVVILCRGREREKGKGGAWKEEVIMMEGDWGWRREESVGGGGREE